MSFLRSLLRISLGVIMGAGAMAPAAAAPAIIQSMPGTWVCTSHGSNGSRSATYTFRSVDANTVQYSYIGRLDPSRRGAGVWKYDTKKRQYVLMGAGPTGWGVSLANAAPSATTLNIVDTYPADPENGTSTYRFNGNSATTMSRWRKNGKPMMQSGVCTKS